MGHHIYKRDGINKGATEKRTRLLEMGKGSLESISASDTLRAESKCSITWHLPATIQDQQGLCDHHRCLQTQRLSNTGQQAHRRLTELLLLLVLVLQNAKQESGQTP